MSTTDRSTLTHEQLREEVRATYAQAATQGSSCCSPAVPTTDEHGTEVFGAALYDELTATEGGEAIVGSLGCGVPTTVAALQDGDVVLDLGSGTGGDVLISARRVAPTGRAIGIDMTDEMLDQARKNAADAGLSNVEFRKGYLEDLPLEDESVDVVISNCVINLAGDKHKVLAEAARVLKAGGRFAISDVVADPDMDDATKRDMQQFTGCIAGALTRSEFEEALATAGLVDVVIQETHRVHATAGSAIVRATKP